MTFSKVFHKDYDVIHNILLPSLNYMHKPQHFLIIYPVHPTTIKYYKFTTVFVTQNKLEWRINYFL